MSKYKEEKETQETIEEAIKYWPIIKTLFDELRVSESIELDIVGGECDCWMYCECHNKDTCKNKKDLCSDGHDHSFEDCNNDCGVECECACTHTEQIVIGRDIKYYSSDYGNWQEINMVRYAEVVGVNYSCQYCRYGCERCKWVNSLLKISDLSDELMSKVEHTAEVLADDAYNAGDRYTEEPEAEDYLKALLLDGINIPVNKVLQV